LLGFIWPCFALFGVSVGDDRLSRLPWFWADGFFVAQKLWSSFHLRSGRIRRFRRSILFVGRFCSLVDSVCAPTPSTERTPSFDRMALRPLVRLLFGFVRLLFGSVAGDGRVWPQGHILTWFFGISKINMLSRPPMEKVCRALQQPSLRPDRKLSSTNSIRLQNSFASVDP
jgi:hypothetical protein